MAIQYRLLRNNKEIGPFTAADLVAQGFKPYDLIWVEGKSASWRYPSELPEFSYLITNVEEQPFDRLYRKPESKNVQYSSNSSNDNSNSDTITVAAVAIDRNKNNKDIATETKVITEVPNPIAAEKSITTIPTNQLGSVTHNVGSISIIEKKPQRPSTKKVHITFPSTKNNSVHTVVAPPVTPQEPVNNKEAIIAEKIVADVTPVYVPAQSPARNDTISNTEKKQSFSSYQPSTNTQANASYFSPLTDTTSSSTEKASDAASVFPSSNMNRTRKKRVIIFSAALLFSVIAFVGIGLYIGVTIDGKPLQAYMPVKISNNFSSSNNENIDVAPSSSNAALTEENISNNAAVMLVNKKEQPITSSTLSKNVKDKNSKTPNKIADNTLAKKETTAKKNIAATYDGKPENFMDVSTNAYTVGGLGGIKNLQCILTNKSSLGFENVTVAITYIQANKQIAKTEQINFKDIRAGQQLILNAPKSGRGITVTCKIISARPL
jgi:hypothetical protein